MQTDIWLTEEIVYSERCPLCSQPLKDGSTTCFSCGFTIESPTGTSVWIDPAVYGYPLTPSQKPPHQVSQEKRWKSARELNQTRRHPNPTTPIPRRASAQVDVVKNSSVWEYESPASQVSGSLPIDSFLISEEPTQPELAAKGKVTQRLSRIDEITTVPPQDADPSIAISRSLVPVHYQSNLNFIDRPDLASTDMQSSREIEAASWTAGEASRSSQAQLISNRSKRKSPNMAVSLNPIDRLRWWLLRPGRLEFILWLGGTVLLVAVTCVLLFVTAFSLEWITPGLVNPSSTNTVGTSSGTNLQSTAEATSKLVLIRIDKGPILPGQFIQIRGQGFTPLGHVAFLFDDTQQLYDRNGQFASTQADARGVFTTSVVLDSNLPWRSGPHVIKAQDIVSKHTATLRIILSPAPIGRGTSNTPVPSYPPVITPSAPTPIPSIPASQPTPVGQTPVPVTPTPQPVTPTPTPTVGTTPTVTPTVGTSPTAVPSVGTAPGATTTVGTTTGSGLGNALDKTGDSYVSKQIAHLNPWVWLMIACYCLSMALLGLAGMLRKRQL